jgi:hypothetical protein
MEVTSLPALSAQISFGFWRPRPPKPPPAPRKSQRYRLLKVDLKSGIRVSFRMARKEYNQLVCVAKRDEVTVSEVVRESLYDAHGIGELEES